ncbi:MAG: ABC transporter substrate-binding protein [Pseudomonadota bacterium]
MPGSALTFVPGFLVSRFELTVVQIAMVPGLANRMIVHPLTLEAIRITASASVVAATRMFATVALAVLLGCTTSRFTSEEARVPGGTIIIATDATFPPFHYLDDAGAATGFDVELARALAQRAGYLTEVIAVPYGRLFDDLLAGRHHVVAATTGITPEREKTYLFSAAYFDTCQAALVRNGVGEPENLSDLARLRVGASGAGTSVAALSQLPNVVPVRLSDVVGDGDAVQKDGRVPTLEQREIDALIVDEWVAVEAAQASFGRLRVLPEPVSLERYGFVFAPHDRDLKRAFDDALAAMRLDGSLRDLRKRFGLDRDTDWPITFR